MEELVVNCSRRVDNYENNDLISDAKEMEAFRKEQAELKDKAVDLIQQLRSMKR